MNNQRHATIGQAAAQAVCLWMIVYFLIAQCLVVWRWQTPDDDRIQLPSTTTTKAAPMASPSTLDRTQQQLRDLQAVLSQLTTAVETTRKQTAAAQQQLTALDRLVRTADRMDAAAAQQMSRRSRNGSNTTGPPSVLKVSQLLAVKDLSQLRSAGAVSKMVTAAKTELERLMAEDDHGVDVYEGLRPVLAQAIDYAPVTATCPAPAAASIEPTATTEPSSTTNNVTVADVADAKAAVLAALRNSSSSSSSSSAYGGPLPVQFTSTVDRLRAQAKAHVKQLSAAAAAATITTSSTTTSSDTNNDDCFTTWDQIDTWLDAAIEAVYRQQDIRKALRDVVDVSVILDADLKMSKDDTIGRTASSGRRAQNAQTLRHLLDTPTLHRSSAWLDTGLDWIGGRHDGLDDLLDRYLYTAVADDASAGRWVTQHILAAAGRVSLAGVSSEDREGWMNRVLNLMRGTER